MSPPVTPVVSGEPPQATAASAVISQLQIEGIVDELVQARMPAAAKDAVSAALAEAAAKRADWKKQVRETWRSYWPVLSIVLLSGLLVTTWEDARIGLHRRLLSFDRTFESMMQHQPVYSMGGTFHLKDVSSGLERSFQLPFVALSGQEATVTYNVQQEFPDNPLGLRVRLLARRGFAAVPVGSILVEQGTFHNVIAEFKKNGEELPPDNIYTLVIEPVGEPAPGKSSFATGTIVIQVFGAPLQVAGAK